MILAITILLSAIIGAIGGAVFMLLRVQLKLDQLAKLTDRDAKGRFRK